MIPLRSISVALVVVGSLAISATASAADKKRCLDAAPRGQELRDQGKLVEARAEFLVCADSGCPAPVPTYCNEWLDDLKKRMPTLVIRVTDTRGRDLTDAKVSLDDRDVVVDGNPLELNPGKHQLRVERAGSRPVQQAIVVAQNEKGRVLAVQLEPDSPPPGLPTSRSDTAEAGKPRPIPLASLVGWSIGGAGLLGFTVFGIKANIDYGDHKDRCGSNCTLADRDDVSGSMLVADVFLAVGVVAAAVGTVIFFTTPPKAEARPRTGEAGSRR